MMMAWKTTLLVLAIAAALFLQFADCMFAMTLDEQNVQCCGSMPCDPSNQTHDCCKSMVSSQSPSALPTAHVSLRAPVVVVGGALASPLVRHCSEPTSMDFASPQHSPPHLYTLHSSFLI